MEFELYVDQPIWNAIISHSSLKQYFTEYNEVCNSVQYVFQYFACVLSTSMSLFKVYVGLCMGNVHICVVYNFEVFGFT